MLRQTVARLRPLIRTDHIWTVTNAEQSASVRKHLPAPARQHILAEPVGRNTAAAIALAAIHIRHADKSGDALMAILPADLYIAQPERYREIARARARCRRANPAAWSSWAFRQRAPKPASATSSHPPSLSLLRRLPRFPGRSASRKNRSSPWPKNTSRPDITAGTPECFSGASPPFSTALQKYLPKTQRRARNSRLQHRHKATIRTNLRCIYPQLENIAVDYAILESATRESGAPRVFVIPADIGWSDIGSWTAVYEQSCQITRGQRHRQPQPRHRRPGQFHLESRKVRRRHRRPRPGRRGNTRRPADLPARSRSGRRQNREMARRAAQKRSALEVR